MDEDKKVEEGQETPVTEDASSEEKVEDKTESGEEKTE